VIRLALSAELAGVRRPGMATATKPEMNIISSEQAERRDDRKRKVEE